jgi:hypothetical protein
MEFLPGNFSNTLAQVNPCLQSANLAATWRGSSRKQIADFARASLKKKK